MDWEGANSTGGYSGSRFYDAPPSDEYSLAGRPPYPPNGQSYLEYGDDGGEIDEEDEYYFKMQDEAEERERALAAGRISNANFEQAEKGPDMSGTNTPVHSTTTPTIQDSATNEEKAAQLRARLLEKRNTSTSRVPVPESTAGMSNSPPSSQIFQNAVNETFGQGLEIDNLVKEARQAAEIEAKKNTPYYYDIEAVNTPVAIENDGKASPAGSMRSTSAIAADPSYALSRKAKKDAKKAKQQAFRNRVTEQQASSGALSASVSSIRDSASSVKSILNGKRVDPSGQPNKGSATDVSTNGKRDLIQAKSDISSTNTNTTQMGDISRPSVVPSRSETLLSASTIHQDAINECGRDPEATVPSSKATGHVMPPASKKDSPASNVSIHIENIPKEMENTSELTGHIHKAEGELRDTAAYSHHFDDLDEWLEITGYHDRLNRNKVLELYRRKADLDRQMAEVERELEQTTVQRARSVRGQLASRAKGRLSLSSMAPPPTPTNGEGIATHRLSPIQSSTETAEVPCSTVAKVASVKRRHSPDRAVIPKGPKHANKLRRLSSSSNQMRTSVQTLEVPSGPSYNLGISDQKYTASIYTGAVERLETDKPETAFVENSKLRRLMLLTNGRTVVPPGFGTRTLGDRDELSRGRAQSTSPLHTRRASFTAREPSPPRREYGRPSASTWNANRPSPQEPNSTGSEYSSSYRGKADTPLSRGGSVRVGRFPDHGGRGDSRYFMIKSWNHDNVQISQRDGTWATQVQNVEILTEAFETCRNVYLCFSVNKSMAFQGYARMESLPGTAPEPSWTKGLRWPASPPFYIRWITVMETRFSKVGHLKNALNEMAAVLVGRDGQEIEENCGRELCLLIDEEQRSGGDLQY